MGRFSGVKWPDRSSFIYGSSRIVDHGEDENQQSQDPLEAPPSQPPGDGEANTAENHLSQDPLGILTQGHDHDGASESDTPTFYSDDSSSGLDTMVPEQ